VGILLGKELRQLRRARGLVASSALLPLVVAVVVPLGLLGAMLAAGSGAGDRSELLRGAPLGLSELTPLRLDVLYILPLFVAIGALALPATIAVQTVVAERERRSLELLVALPVTVRDIVLAKLLALFALGAAVMLPLAIVDGALVVGLRLASPLYLPALLLLTLGALGASIAIALLMALLASDSRTASQITGAGLMLLTLLGYGVVFAVPEGPRPFALALTYAGVAAVATAACIRWLSFERYLG
jgi:ABC-type Na+ efflux pump permease subunit